MAEPVDNYRLGLTAVWQITQAALSLPAELAPPPHLLLEKGIHTAVVAQATQYAHSGVTSPPSPPSPQLQSIFSQLFAEAETGNGVNPKASYLPLRPRQLNQESLFPGPAWSANAQKEAQESLRQGVHDALRQLQAQPTSTAATYLTNLLTVLQTWTSQWPSPTTPDVSLYDYVGTVAALVPGVQEAGSTPDAPVALLLKGDVSGVQDFIYTISSRGAASGLRARSLYLQLLTEAVARYLLDRLGLPSTHLLGTSGGHFFLLLPPSAAAQLPALQVKISQTLLTHHAGALYVALGWATLHQADFTPEGIGRGWQRMTDAVNIAKSRRFSELDDATLYAQLFDVTRPGNEGGHDQNECTVCHYDGAAGVTEVANERGQRGTEAEADNNDEDVRYLCGQCASFEELGKRLRHTEQLLIWHHAPDETRSRGTAVDALAALGMTFTPFTPFNPAHEKPYHPPAATREARILSFALETDALWAGLPTWAEAWGVPVALTVQAAVQVMPSQARKDGPGTVVADFETLAVERSKGINRFGVLRMDVDDLGTVFSHGLHGRNSLLRSVALSRAMALFFEGWVGKLAQTVQAQQKRDTIYSVYAGGDDLFMVAGWDILPELAQRINEDLQAYAAGNRFIHASAGITLHTAKFPMYRAAEMAHDALEAAKGWETNGVRTKNALTFLGQTRPWESYPDLEQEFTTLRTIAARDKVPHQFLQTLRRLYLTYERHKQTQVRATGGRPAKVYWGPWHWRSAYLLTRLADRVEDDDDEEGAQMIRYKRDELVGEGFREIETIGLAARWAEFYLRKSQTDKESVDGEQ